MRRVLIPLLSFFLAATVFAQAPEPATAKALSQHDTSMDRGFEVDAKMIDDVLWHLKVGDVAAVDKVQLASSKPIRMKNPTGQGAGNPLIIPAYVFTPKNLKGKAPLIVFIHGGVHGDFETSYAHIVRELIEQGYVIVAPEYRGSTGYGEELYEQIDYGGAEIDAVKSPGDRAGEDLTRCDWERG